MTDDLPTAAYERTIAHLGWTARPEQVELVQRLRTVATAPQPQQTVVQAGTGVGKTLAVLTVGAEVGRPGRPALVLIVTNGLAGQYVGRDADAVHAATGARIARVIGAGYYLCASSQAGVDAGLPQEYEDDQSANAEAILERNAWLETQADEAPWATRWERQPHHRAADYGCPGWPACEGGAIGGCGKRHARARGLSEADVVVSNYHLATIQHRLPALDLLPQPVLTVVDEAHALPDVIAAILSAEIGPGFGGHELTGEMGDPQRDRAAARLFDYVHRLRAGVLAGVQWRQEDRFHTEARVSLLSPARAADVAEALSTYEGVEDIADTNELEATAGDGLSVSAVLHTLVASATDPTIVPVVHRPPADPAEPAPEGARPDTLYLRRADVAEFIAGLLGDRAALVSGTIPTTLAARCGLPQVDTVDVGHPFRYADQVRGYLSRYDGTKAVNRSHTRADRDRLFGLRAAELERFLLAAADTPGGVGGLVLCASHDDVARLARTLEPRLRPRGVTVHTQPRYGGSEAAMRRVDMLRTDRAHGRSSVIIGVDSLATGLDLPGDLLTRVAWWSLPLGRSDTVDEARQRLYPGDRASGVGRLPAVGSYLDDRLRVKITQGVGRLIRTVTDRGEILLCDRRFRDHLTGSTSVLDAHLRQIPWDWAPAMVEQPVA